VRSLITSRTSWSRVYFNRINERSFSDSEVTVSGQGVVSKSDGWDGMPFKFSVKVRKNYTDTRDISVDFADGKRLVAEQNWRPPANRDDDDVTITNPSWFETMRGRSFDFRGESENRLPLTVIVFDRQGRRVEQKTVKPNNRGDWSVRMSLDDGTYRAIATHGGRSNGDEVRFSVGRSSGGWGNGNWDWENGGWNGGPGPGPGTGFPGSRPIVDGPLSLDSPSRNQDVPANNVRASGRTDDDTVKVQIFQDDRKVLEQRVDVRNGRWVFETRLAPDSYRMVVMCNRERNRVEVRFRAVR